jgi:excisionase family DNA binding protein
MINRKKDDMKILQDHVSSDYLRASEAASMLHVSPKTVSRWAKEGKIPHFVTLGGHRRFPKDAIERLASDLESLEGP